AGARVDPVRTGGSGGVVRFPRRLVQEAIASNQRLLRQGRKMVLLNGVTSERTDGSEIRAKVSGGCDRYLDWESDDILTADPDALLRFIRLGEMLPEVSFVGNPIVLSRDRDGRPIDERTRRIRTAALIAKNTRKLGSVEVWSEAEIDLLVEIGTIARGSREAYLERPCLVTAKETISPLFLDENAGDILLALAARGLPCTVIPMPLTGLNAPVTPLGNAIVGNAEILGTVTAVKAFHPEALVGGGTISGVLDMRTGVVSFSAPEAILQDIALAEVHERLYGFDYLIGSGYTDAKYPAGQVLAEKTAKFLFTFLSGRTSYPLGLISAGSVFSDLQCLVDLELCRYIHGHFAPFGGAASSGESEELDELVELIDQVGVQGNYVEQEHTLAHFRERWLPQLFDRSSFVSLEDSRARDLYAAARSRLGELYSAGDYWELEPERQREIDRVVRSAEKTLA
ncbi:MAG: trimethylamine methyltransferase family protein, partial [Spirochaetales bacterium]|nr:trimethylamine methyltransferase family protein [Spirochaetales bacterium]